MTGLPVVKVEVAFNAGVRTPAASRTWTDITSYCELQEGIGVIYGRSDERSHADANVLTSITLNNTDGRFTPGLASSPYYPNVKVGRPIRVSVTPPGGSLSTRFTGYVDEWPTEWPTSTTLYAVARVTASSRMALLGQSYPLKSIIEQEILSRSPDAYYTMGEAEGAAQANDSSGKAAPPLIQSGTGTAVLFGTATGPGTDDLTAATLANGGRSLVAYEATGVQSGLGFFISTAGFAAGTFTARMGGIIIDITDTGAISASTVFGASIGPVATSVTDGGVHHVELDTSAGSTVLYVDGVSVGSVAVGGAVGGKFGASFSVAGSGTSGTGTVSLSHIAADVQGAAAIWAAGSTGFAGETPAARIARYASYAEIPVAEQSLEAGTSPIAHFDPTGTSVIDAMHVVEDTEGGVLFDGHDGILTFYARDKRYTASVGLTLDASAQEINADFAPRFDRQGLLNDVTAATKDGTVTANSVDVASVTEHGAYVGTIELATTDINQPQDAADWAVYQYAEPRARVASVTVDVMTLGLALQTSILAANVGTRVQVTNQPAQAATATGDYFIEGYSENISHQSHTITFNLSSATAYITTLILDSATRGLLDTNILAY